MLSAGVEVEILAAVVIVVLIDGEKAVVEVEGDDGNDAVDEGDSD